MPYARSSIQTFQLSNAFYAGAEVSFYTVDEDGERTATLASLYAATTGAALLENPQTLDAYGKFEVPVYIEDPVIGLVSPNENLPSGEETGIISYGGRWRGAYVGTTIYYANDLVQDPSTSIVYAATETFTATSVAADVLSGYLEVFLEPEAISNDYLPKVKTIQAKTAAHSVSTDEAGYGFTNAGAAGSVTFTLPAAAAGLGYSFYVAAAQNLVLQNAAGDSIVNGGDATTTGGTAYCATVGSIISIMGRDDTTWIVENISGTWTTT